MVDPRSVDHIHYEHQCRYSQLAEKLEMVTKERDAARREVERLRETACLAERFVRAKGRFHSQHAMCDLLEHFEVPCVRPGGNHG